MAKGGRREGAGRPKGASNTDSLIDQHGYQLRTAQRARDARKKKPRKSRGKQPPRSERAAAVECLADERWVLYEKAKDVGELKVASEILEELENRALGKVRWQVAHEGVEGSAPILHQAVPAGLYQVEFADGQIAIPAPAIGTAAAAPSNGGARARARVRARRRKAKRKAAKPRSRRQRSRPKDPA